jgi:putative SOS response-associated peptidase YedK
MCYYVSIKIAKKDNIKVSNVAIPTNRVPLHKPLQNGFSYAPWPIIKQQNNTLTLLEAHWEFIANWNKDWETIKENRKKFTTLNAKGETIFSSKLYQQAANEQRCLVLVSGFYEWRTIQLPNLKKPVKVPYYITVKEKEYFFIAGIYNNWVDTTSGEILTNFAIVTTAANSVMEQIHNSQKRMPVILPDAEAMQWINEKDNSIIEQLATYQINAESLDAYTIDREFRTLQEPNARVDYDVVPELVY